MDIFNIENDVNIGAVLSNLHHTDNIYNKYKHQARPDRNVWLIGRVGTDKSTVVSVLGDVVHTLLKPTFHTETNSPVFHKLTSPVLDGKFRLFLTVANSPGFFARPPSRISVQPSCNNDAALAFTDLCRADNITNVHLFALVINLAGKINQEDYDHALCSDTWSLLEF